MEKFDEIIDSFINGQHKQGKAMIKKLSIKERKDLYYDMRCNDIEASIFNAITVAMITRDFK